MSVWDDACNRGLKYLGVQDAKNRKLKGAHAVFGNICIVFLYMITLQALFCLLATEEIDGINSINYSQTRLTDTRLIWTPHYYRQFALSLEKESPQLHFL